MAACAEEISATLMSPEIVERHLKAAERHIAVGKACITRQQGVIERLEYDEGHENFLIEANRLLAQFLSVQALLLAHRDWLICELGRKATGRRIAQGQFRIAQQREMISRLESRGEDSRSAKDQLALLEGTQATLLSHRDRLEEMGADDAEQMCRMQAALLSLLRTGLAEPSARHDA